MTPDDRRQALDQIAAEVSACRLCPLHVERTKAVPGEGNPETEVVFVGEGPGYNEDREGRPFVGQAGGLLNELLMKIGWQRSDVFITNVVKCRPPGNRDPEPNEIATCAPYLKRQLEVLDPAVIVTLGRHSLGTFMPGARISQSHGTSRATDPETGAAAATTYAMYHPAAALRQHTLKETMLVDMCGLPDVLLEARDRRATTTTSTVAPLAPEMPEIHAAATAVEAATTPEQQPVLVAIPIEESPITDMPSPDETEALLEVVAASSASASSTEPQLELFG
ncbi:MAG: uracil-DNA glycosylase [Candidatus Limnocylindrales bacterium]